VRFALLSGPFLWFYDERWPGNTNSAARVGLALDRV
jgi:hypothetical protein